MKLSSKQVNILVAYLESMRLTQVDLRNEVLDHMANGIERAMCEQHLDFSQAYTLETRKWHQELADFSSLWIGWAWHGPKIMIRKCAKKTREIVGRTIVLALILTGFFYILSLYFNLKPYYPTISNCVGLLYFGCFAAMLFFYYKIVASGYHSSYRYLYKINIIGVGFMYLLMNPFWVLLLKYDSEAKILLAGLFMYSYFSCYAYTFWDLYQSHRVSKKLKTA